MGLLASAFDPDDVVPGTNTPKGTIVTLRGRGMQPIAIQQALPNLTVKQIEAVLKEAKKA